jgi:hypothetical protein
VLLDDIVAQWKTGGSTKDLKDEALGFGDAPKQLRVCEPSCAADVILLQYRYLI